MDHLSEFNAMESRDLIKLNWIQKKELMWNACDLNFGNNKKKSEEFGEIKTCS